MVLLDIVKIAVYVTVLGIVLYLIGLAFGISPFEYASAGLSAVLGVGGLT